MDTTVRELSAMLDKEVLVEFGDLWFDCVIKDARQNFGRTDYLITPVNGEGETWVESTRIKESEE